MKCPKCDKEDMFSAYRVRRLVEFKRIETDKEKLQEEKYKTKVFKPDTFPYRGGTWILDNNSVGDFIKLRCSNCDSTINRDEIKGYADFDIDAKKGMSMIRSVTASFFGGDEQVRKNEDDIKTALRKHGVGENKIKAQQLRRKRVEEIKGTLDDIGLDATDKDTIRVYLGDIDIKDAHTEDLPEFIDEIETTTSHEVKIEDKDDQDK